MRPPFLKKNDKVAIIATAKNFNKSELEPAINILKEWGLKVLEGENLYKKYHQYAGTDQDRAEDLQWALDNEEIKAVFCARGGYGTARIIDEISFKKITKYPKWIIGFSDITVLHSQLRKNGIESIHGMMPIHFAKKEYKFSLEKLRETLFGHRLQYELTPHKFNVYGKASGKLVGGNLSILCSLIGTNNEIKMKGNILFLEDVGENLYRLDRMIVHLKRAGYFKSLAGLILGHFNDMEDNEVPFGKSPYEIIAEAVNEYNYPVCYGFPAGHAAHNLPLILGVESKISVTDESVILKNF